MNPRTVLALLARAGAKCMLNDCDVSCFLLFKFGMYHTIAAVILNAVDVAFCLR